jgi:hypothetical protein
MIAQLKKKLELFKVCDTLRIYAKECHPEVQLTEKQFDSVFCGLLNNTGPLFKIMKEGDHVDVY